MGKTAEPCARETTLWFVVGLTLGWLFLTHLFSYQILIINHYLGTWEQFSFRNDPRTAAERSEAVRTHTCVCFFVASARKQVAVAHPGAHYTCTL
jgi:hypothetical protein